MRTVRGFARANHLDRFALHIRLAATAADSAEDFPPGRNHHLGADFARRRAFGRDDGRHSQGLALIEKFFHLVIDRVFLFASRSASS